MKTALVLGAGGFTGRAFEAGVLCALRDVTGWDARSAHLIVGTSAGSHVGTGLRYGFSPCDMYAHELKRPLSAEGQAMFDRIGPVPDGPMMSAPRMQAPSLRLVAPAMRHPWRTRGGLIAAALPRGTIDTSLYCDALRRITGTEWCPEGLWIVGARLPLGERVVFGRDAGPACDIPTAVAASCAVPGLFAPVEIEGEVFIDGGVHSPTNADLLVDEDVDEVIIVSPMSGRRGDKRLARVNPMRVFFAALLGGEVRALRKAGKKVTVYQPGIAEQRAMGVNALDERRCPRVAELAYESTMRRLEVPAPAAAA